jgi:hypothetical protein
VRSRRPAAERLERRAVAGELQRVLVAARPAHRPLPVEHPGLVVELDEAVDPQQPPMRVEHVHLVDRAGPRSKQRASCGSASTRRASSSARAALRRGERATRPSRRGERVVGARQARQHLDRAVHRLAEHAGAMAVVVASARVPTPRCAGRYWRHSKRPSWPAASEARAPPATISSSGRVPIGARRSHQLPGCARRCGAPDRISARLARVRAT